MRVNVEIDDFVFLLPNAEDMHDLIAYVNRNVNSNIAVKNGEYRLLSINDNFDFAPYIGNKGTRYFTKQTKYLLSTIMQIYKNNEIITHPDCLGIVSGSTFCSIEDWGFLANSILSENSYKGIPPGFSSIFSSNLSSSIGSIKTQALAFNVTYDGIRESGYNALSFAIDSINLGNAETIIVSAFENIGNTTMNLLRKYSIKEQQILIGEGSISLLLNNTSSNKNKTYIKCYNEDCMNYVTLNDLGSINQCINSTLQDVDMDISGIDFIVTDIYESKIEDIVHKYFIQNKQSNIISSNKIFANFFSINNILNFALTSALLQLDNNNDFFNFLGVNKLADKKEKNALILYIGHNGYVHTSIISNTRNINKLIKY